MKLYSLKQAVMSSRCNRSADNELLQIRRASTLMSSSWILGAWLSTEGGDCHTTLQPKAIPSSSNNWQ